MPGSALLRRVKREPGEDNGDLASRGLQGASASASIGSRHAKNGISSKWALKHSGPRVLAPGPQGPEIPKGHFSDTPFLACQNRQAVHSCTDNADSGFSCRDSVGGNFWSGWCCLGSPGRSV